VLAALQISDSTVVSMTLGRQRYQLGETVTANVAPGLLWIGDCDDDDGVPMVLNVLFTDVAAAERVQDGMGVQEALQTGMTVKVPVTTSFIFNFDGWVAIKRRKETFASFSIGFDFKGLSKSSRRFHVVVLARGDDDH
jgi:hypothetical protein